MKHATMIFTFICLNTTLLAQENTTGKTNIVLGAAGPELFHAGVTYRPVNTHLLGITAGAGPSSGTVWTALSLEHRWYVGKDDSRINRKTWFLRQGTTYFPAATKPSQHFTFNFTAGKDIPFKNVKNGITIDAGVFYLADSESSSIILIRSLNLWPALRFQFYFSL